MAKRNFPWKCEILDTVKAAALDRAKKELIPVLKARIHEMLKSKYNEQTEISESELRGQLKPVIRGVRDTYSLTNAETQSIAKISQEAYRHFSLSILDWCGLEYTRLTRTDEDGKETVYIKIKNLHNGEEE